MAFVLNDRVKETSTTTGTGTITLDGASLGYQSFSAGIGNTNTTYYAIYLSGSNEWEVGIGTVGSGTLSRDVVLQSSNSDAKVSFSAGTKDVFVTYPADRAVYKETSGNAVQFPIWETSKSVSGAYSITSGNDAVSYGAITITTGSSVTVPTGDYWLVNG
jgi:hypothetical protein